MVRRFARVIGVAALVLSGTGCLAGNAALARSTWAVAQATKTYSSAAFGYSFSYPGEWKLLHEKGVDIAVTTSDRHALMLAIVVKGKMSASDIKAQTKELVAVPGTVQGKPGYSVQPVNGVPFQGWQAVTKSKGTSTEVIAIGTAHGKFTYFFLAGVDLKQPKTAAYSNQMGDMVNSITLH